jgi:hypothetical protein
MFWRALLSLWLCLGVAQAQETAPTVSAAVAAVPEPTGPHITGLIFYATTTAPTDLPEKPLASDAKVTSLHPRIQRVIPASQHLTLLGRHTTRLGDKYATWVVPSPQFPLEVENTGPNPAGGFNLYWKLWQKEPLPRKDRELVKSSSILVPGTPVIIGGPKWREGRLVFVLQLE